VLSFSWSEVGGVGATSAPGVTRTPGQRFRKPLLYPPELRGQGSRSGPSPIAARTTISRGESTRRGRLLVVWSERFYLTIANGFSSESAPTGASLRTSSTRAPPGPSATAASSLAMAPLSPPAASSTIPSGLFLTHPDRPSSRPISMTYQRNPTPCTRPRISRCMLSTADLCPNSQYCGQGRCDGRGVSRHSRQRRQFSVSDSFCDQVERVGNRLGRR
jgi:hypothetical protein